MFDLSLTKILVLAVIALVVFGPHELPKVAAQAGRMLRRFVRKHLLDDLDETSQGLLAEFNGSSALGSMGGGTTFTGTAAGRGTLLDGEDPPFDSEAT